jgi:UDP-glucose 4-epimerase
MAAAVCEAAERHGARVVATGSAAQYGAGAPQPLSESAPLVPVTAYGVGKCVLEQATTTLGGGARVIWARSFNLVGPGQQESAPIGRWTRKAVELESHGGGTISTGNLSSVRDFLDVRDAACFLLDLGETTYEGAVNVCSGEATALATAFDAVRDAATVPIGHEVDERLVRERDPAVVVGDPTLLHSLVGHRPRYSLQESVRAAMESLRATESVQS